MKAIVIAKGDDSGAFGLRQFRIKIDENCLEDGMTASFTLLSFVKEFTADEVATGVLDFELTGSVTKSFPLGVYFATFRLYDANAKVFTLTGRIPFEVVAAGSLPEIPVQMLTFTTDVMTIRVGFHADYADLDNKPSIEGVTVSGDKTAADYGLATATELAAEVTRATEAEATLDDKVNGKQAQLDADQLAAVNSGITADKVAEIGTTTVVQKRTTGDNIATVSGVEIYAPEQGVMANSLTVHRVKADGTHDSDVTYNGESAETMTVVTERQTFDTIEAGRPKVLSTDTSPKTYKLGIEGGRFYFEEV